MKLKGGGRTCSTDILHQSDHSDTVDFGDGGIATFGGGVDSEDAERAMLRDCYQVKSILRDGYIYRVDRFPA